MRKLRPRMPADSRINSIASKSIREAAQRTLTGLVTDNGCNTLERRSATQTCKCAIGYSITPLLGDDDLRVRHGQSERIAQ
jgi:hypothetical protein